MRVYDQGIRESGEYSRVLHEVQDNVTNVTPELLAKLQAEAEKQRWWVAQSEWIESVVRL